MVLQIGERDGFAKQLSLLLIVWLENRRTYAKLLSL